MKHQLKYVLSFLVTIGSAFAAADGTQVDGAGSPVWFSWVDFCYGSGAAFVIVGPMFVYWVVKRSAGNALG